LRGPAFPRRRCRNRRKARFLPAVPSCRHHYGASVRRWSRPARRPHHVSTRWRPAGAHGRGRAAGGEDCRRTGPALTVLVNGVPVDGGRCFSIRMGRVSCS
jgi:hypothetical protein